MVRSLLFRSTAAAALAGIGVSAHAQLTFNDIQFWTGTGSNQAALVIDWKSGPAPQSQVWGFRWDGAATGRTMFDAILAADPRLYREWLNTPGGAVFGIGFDADGDGFAKTDTGDNYKEGWVTNGYWAYYVSNAGSSLPSPWQFSGSGISQRNLVNGSWDGWSWAQNFRGTPPSVPLPATVPVPEPGAVALLAAGVSGLVLSRRKRRQA